MARPSKLTPATQTRIVTALRRGVPRGRAARLAGISPDTMSQWMGDGAKQESGKHRDFYDAVLRAEDEWVEKAMGAVTDLLDDADPRVRLNAAKFGLTHRFREDFARRTEQTGTLQHEHSGPGGTPIAVQTPPLVSNEQLQAATGEQLGGIIAGLIKGLGGEA